MNIRQCSLSLLKLYKCGRTLIGSTLVLKIEWEFHWMRMSFIYLTPLNRSEKAFWDFFYFFWGWVGVGGSFSSIFFFQILFRDRGLHFLRNEVAHIKTQKKKKKISSESEFGIFETLLSQSNRYVQNLVKLDSFTIQN